MSSPYIVTLAGQPSGVLRGQDAVAVYWQKAMQRHTDLNFELLKVFVGASGLVLLYKAVEGKRASEVLLLDEDGQITKAIAHYNAP